ncbi:alpha/beta hydrolase family protein [Micromonospora sp. NPDC093277]|uniref:alpha/beta hydrolase family protein n=1 Tax=Micromonospora sp. NPDC093277 TaxID=3364291 RepID=UPI0037F32C25
MTRALPHRSSGGQPAGRRIARIAAAGLGLLLLPLIGVRPADAAPIAADHHRTTGVPASRTLAPTGPLQRLGTTTLHLVDHGRPDPWVPAAGDRQLMVSLFYPASAAPGPGSPYVSTTLAPAVREWGVPGVPEAKRAAVRPERLRGHAVVDAPASLVAGGRPLVILSPGFELSRTSLTMLAEELASRGYLAAVVDHPYEAPVELPDGRVTACAICGTRDPAVGLAIVRSRTADLRFVLDVLSRRSMSWLVDASRVAVAGHSIGGASAVEVARTDGRFDAAVNLDGMFFAELPNQHPDVPVLLVSQGVPTAGPQAFWPEAWAALAGPRRWLDVTGAGHYTFADTVWLLDRFGVRSAVTPDVAGLFYGTMAGTRGVEITRAYVVAFLDRHLRGKPGDLLDAPSRAYPEVTFVG